MARRLANGTIVSVCAPLPRDFDPGKASDRERRRYGLLSIPEAPELQARLWDDLARHRYMKPKFRSRRGRTGLPNWRTDHPDQHTGSWAGAVCAAPPGDPLTWVQGAWTVPVAALPFDAEDGASYTVSTWIGLDGSLGSHDVVQAGFDSTVTFSGDSVDHSLTVWSEWYPGSSSTVSFPVSAGDQVSWLVRFGGAATAALTNQTTGDHQQFNLANPGAAFSGNCAEWIVEAVGGAQLARFAPLIFSGCQAGTAGGTTLRPANGQSVQMVDGEDNPLATASIPAADQVQIVYG